MSIWIEALMGLHCKRGDRQRKPLWRFERLRAPYVQVTLLQKGFNAWVEFGTRINTLLSDKAQVKDTLWLKQVFLNPGDQSDVFN